ncbi:MAG: hypothetical protein KAR06_10465, partial [Deltaproteobacteria bacterium]|nr:hypothetical protein [Deltaproteobacteria bacterium]
MTRDHGVPVFILLFLITALLLPSGARAEVEPARGAAGKGSVTGLAVIYRNGVDHARQGHFKEAAAEFSLLNKAEQMDVPLKEVLKAVEDADARRLDRKAVARLFKGIYSFSSGDYLMAMDELSRATELDPSMSLAYFYRAGIYIAVGQNANAVSELDMAIDLNPEFAFAYSTRGAALYKILEFKKALFDFNRAIVIDPSLAT